jgi:uncharacterized protein (TIRG00374 family)
MITDSLIGLFYGLFIPTGLAGDAIRAIRLGNRHCAMQKAFLSVIVDRAVGLVSVLLLFGTQFIESSSTRSEVRMSWVGWSILAGLAATVVIVIGGSPLLQRLAKWALKERRQGLSERWPFTLLIRQIGQLQDTVQEYSEGRRFVFLSVVASMGYQLLVTLAYYVGGVLLETHVDFRDYVWIIALVTLAQALPITVAGLGVREGLLVFLLDQYGVSATTSVALSLSVFSVTLLFGIFGGVFELIGTYKSSTSIINARSPRGSIEN